MENATKSLRDASCGVMVLRGKGDAPRERSPVTAHKPIKLGEATPHFIALKSLNLVPATLHYLPTYPATYLNCSPAARVATWNLHLGRLDMTSGRLLDRTSQ